LGPDSFQHVLPPGQEGCRPRRARRCLLKDCERWFEPARPQSRYCSGACAAAARRWRCVQASRRYRASAGGRVRRREQNRQYRQRRREREQAAASAEAATVREGQRPASGGEDFCARMCERPGCYVTFVVKHEASCRRFCSVACRLALRRVLDREARYRQRRRPSWRGRGGRSSARPRGP
jgi:hypothetical protein